MIMKYSAAPEVIRLNALIVVLVCFLIVGPAFSGTATTRINTTNSCVVSSLVYNRGSSINVVKQLTGVKNCSLTNFNNATCNPGAASMIVTNLSAIATGSQITMNPRCNWNCAACPGISIDGASGGLPVELMEFGVARGDQEQ